jgi:hypothetical protein
LSRILNDKACPHFARFMCLYDMALGVCQQRMTTSRRLRCESDYSATVKWIGNELSETYDQFVEHIMQHPDVEMYIFIDNACRKYEQRFQRVDNAVSVQSRTFTVVGTVIAREEFGAGVSSAVPQYVCVSKDSAFYGQSISHTKPGTQFATCLGSILEDSVLEFRRIRTMHEAIEACPDIADVSEYIRMPVSTHMTEQEFFDARLEEVIHQTLACVICSSNTISNEIKLQAPPWDGEPCLDRIKSSLNKIAGKEIDASVPARIVPHPAFKANEMTKAGMSEILLTIAESRPFRFSGPTVTESTSTNNTTDKGRPFAIGDQLTMKNIRAVQEATEDKIFEGFERKKDMEHFIQIAERVHAFDEVKPRVHSMFVVT